VKSLISFLFEKEPSKKNTDLIRGKKGTEMETSSTVEREYVYNETNKERKDGGTFRIDALGREESAARGGDDEQQHE